MVKIPVRFNRVAAAFDEAARLCESSGSEHSAASEGSSDNLSYLVASFMEKDGCLGQQDLFNFEEEINDGNSEYEESEVNSNQMSDSETKDTLKNLLGFSGDSEKEMIRTEVSVACKSIGSDELLTEGFKRQLMARLRGSGFDAGLCKSRWQKSGIRPAGDYRYIDINMNKNRYIVEVNFGGHFEIARPTDRFSSLLELFPYVFVGRAEEIKRVVRLMCGAMKQSLKSKDLAMPPWRRNSYMQSKWLASYKRTTNSVPTKKLSELKEGALAGKCSVGFVASTVRYYRCRDDFSSETNMRIGQLTATFRNN